MEFPLEVIIPVVGAMASAIVALWKRNDHLMDKHAQEREQWRIDQNAETRRLCDQYVADLKDLHDDYREDIVERMERYQEWAELNRQAIEQDTIAMTEFKATFGIYKMMQELRNQDGAINEL